MSQTTLKRLSAPKTWAIKRKTGKFIVKNDPGAHAMERSIPLLVMVRDIFRMSNIARDAKAIINGGKVLIDNRIVKNYKFSVGLMDTVHYPATNKSYRVLMNVRGKLVSVEIPPDEKAWKLDRIENTITIRGGETVITLFDGRVINLKGDKGTDYKVGDVLKIELPTQKILVHYKMEENNVAYVWKGKNVGRLGTISKYEIKKSGMANLVYFKEGFMSTSKNVYVVGKGVPEIRLPEVTL